MRPLRHLLTLAGAAEIWVSSKAGHVADLVRPEMTEQGLAQHRADFETAKTAFVGVNEQLFPAVASQLGISESDFRNHVRTRYPAIGQMLAAQAEIIPFAEQSLLNLERQQDRFHRADALPASGLPGYAGGVADCLLGLSVAACALRLSRPRSRRETSLLIGAIAAVSVLMIALPLMLQVPGKAKSADTVLGSLNPSVAVVERTETSFASGQRAAAEFDSRLIPDLAATFNMSRPAFEARLRTQFPNVAASLQALPDVMARYEARVAIRSGGADDLRSLKQLPIAILGWFDPAYGAVIAIVLGAALLAGRTGKTRPA
jgi:hypothetical protein